MNEPTNSKDSDVYVRWGAAGNPSCPADALALLAKDSDVDVRRGAARNPSCPADALALLAGVQSEAGLSDEPQVGGAS